MSKLSLVFIVGLLALFAIQTYRLHQAIGAAAEMRATLEPGARPGDAAAGLHAHDDPRFLLENGESNPYANAEDALASALLGEAFEIMLDIDSSGDGRAASVHKRPGAKSGDSTADTPPANAKRREEAARARRTARDAAKSAAAKAAERSGGPERAGAAKLMSAAQRLIQAGAYDEAAAALEESIAADPANTRAYRALASLYRKLGLSMHEQDVYQDWIAQRPGDATPHYLLADALLRGGFDAEALAEVSQFQQLAGDTVSSYPMAASIYRRMGMVAEEGALLEAWVAETPGSADARQALAQHYQRAGNYPAAVAEYQTVVDLLPQNAQAHANLASAYQRLNMHAEAQNELVTAIQLRPNSSNLYLQLADSYRRGGDLYAAVETYQNVIDLSPESREARQAVQAINRIQRQINRPKASA